MIHQTMYQNSFQFKRDAISFVLFCVVPYTRGVEFSRPVEDIQKEVLKYNKKGVQEIILLGQNVNAYHGIGADGKAKDLAYLINTISELDTIKRIRYMTSHPIDMSDSFNSDPWNKQ